MNALIGSAAPASGPEIPEFATLAADPEIAPLLRFDPVVRKVKRPDGWTPELQRELVARIAATGTVQSAVWQMGKHATGAEALYKTPGAAVDDSNYGALSHPARGYSKEEWAKMDTREQELARERQHHEDAEEQRSWEAAARADWQERQGPEDRRAQS